MTTSAALVEMLRLSGLLESSQVDQIVQSLAESPRGAEPLAHELVARDWLTPYQSEQLLLGRPSELVLGPYLILEPAGKGRVGHVFRARHRERGHVVAVKVIRQDLRADPQVLQRFRREVKAISRLTHPNLVQARDVDEVGTAHFFAMEYVAGLNLAELLDQVGPLPVGPACDYIRQAALGMQHAFEQGMIHRDIKPANLLIAPPAGLGAATARQGRWGTAKVLDLGLALLQQGTSGSGEGPSLTMPGFALGTVDYMAPEQVLSPHEVDIRADVYALGCTFYHALTGQPPFPEGELIDKLNRHRHSEPQPLEELRPEASPALAGVVRKMMAKRPEMRYATPVEVAKVLATVLERLDRTQLALDWQLPGAVPKTTASSHHRVEASPVELSPTRSLVLIALAIVIFVGSFVICWLLVAP